MNPSTTSFKSDENRRIEYPMNEYPPPPHYGGGYPPMGHPPPQPMPGYGGYNPYGQGQYPPPYGYPHPPPPSSTSHGYAPPSSTGHGYAPPMGYPSAKNVQEKKKKKGMGRFLALGAGLVGGLLLGDLAMDIGAESFESFSESGGGGIDQLCDASMQASSESIDAMGSIG